jgi:NADPH-dependent curcumin reductase CurA
VHHDHSQQAWLSSKTSTRQTNRTQDAIARVLKSDNPDYAPGDLVRGFLPIAEHATIPREMLGAIRGKIDNKHNFELGVFLGALGMPSLTAYSSLFKIGQPKSGETIFISSAAGAVGMMAGQIAKREGLTVIGSVGTDEKLDYIVKELGFDSGFNYKTEKPADALKRLAPQGIDIYFDNVGGEHLEAAIDAMNNWGRIIACGMVSPHPGVTDA